MLCDFIVHRGHFHHIIILVHVKELPFPSLSCRLLACKTLLSSLGKLSPCSRPSDFFFSGRFLSVKGGPGGMTITIASPNIIGWAYSPIRQQGMATPLGQMGQTTQPRMPEWHVLWFGVLNFSKEKTALRQTYWSSLLCVTFCKHWSQEQGKVLRVDSVHARVVFLLAGHNIAPGADMQDKK